MNQHKLCSSYVQSAEDIDLSLQKKFRPKIIELCQPLNKTFGVLFFSQSRAFHNGQFSSLMTEPELTECFLKRKYPITFSYGRGFYLNEGFYTSTNYTKTLGLDEKLKIFYDEFKVTNMMTIIKKHQNYDDMYSFGLSGADENRVNVFLNNMKMIEHFLCYFKNESFNLLNKIERVSYSHEFFSQPADNRTIHEITDDDKNLFYNTLPLKKVRVQGLQGEVTLSQREYECFHHAITCYSIKEIAKKMNISHRTAETYLDNLKTKLGVEKRSDLLTINNLQNNALIY